MDSIPPNYSNEIVQTVREPLLVLDSNLRVIVASPSFYRVFRTSTEHTLGRRIYELGNGQWDIPALRDLLDRLLPGNGHFDDYEVVHTFPEIGRRTMLLNARRLHDGPDTPPLILLAIEDTTDRRRAELEIARQKTWFCVIDVIFDDRGNAEDYRFLATNPAFEKQSGLSSSVGKRIRELAPDHDARWFELYGKVALTGKAIRFVNEGKLPGDTSFDIYAFRLGGAESRRVGLLFADISERRRAEKSLKSSELRYRRLFEAAHDGILLLHSETHLINDVNPFMLELLDQPREYFIGRTLWQIGIFPDAAANGHAMQQLHARGSHRFNDVDLKDRNGRPHPVEIVANLYHEEDHRVIQCNLRDVSERIRAERERQAMLANEQSLRIEAEAANRAKDTFLATLSHELRTPLNAILGWSVLLRSAPANEESVIEAANVIERNARMQQQLIEDVLDVSRIVSGKLRLDMKSAELSKIIEDAVAAVQQAADAKDIKINVQVMPDASPIICDANRIQQVIWNLLTNAIKFSPQAGNIDILVQRIGSTVRITITDEGAGISAEFLPHVFERFRQQDGTSTRKHGGLGLGLSIVRQLVELHGGSVSVESEGPGQGATFIVNLPIRAVMIQQAVTNENDTANGAATPVPITFDPNAPAVRLDGLRILTIDDEADARAVIKAALEMAGATVAVAESVSRALELLPQVRPHLVVSDLSMPGQDGYDLIAQIRAKGPGYTARELPAVALTAYARPEDRRKVWAAGYQMHVSKPVDPHELVAIVASQLGQIGTAGNSGVRNPT